MPNTVAGNANTPGQQAGSGAPTDDSPPGGPTVNRVASVATSAALGGAAAGALAGALGGPIGAAVGAAVGAVAAGFAGNSIVDSIDADAEAAYWRDNYRQRPYVQADADFGQFEPAYAYGVDGYVKHRGSSFDDAEPHLSRGWAESRRGSGLSWDHARPAARDAWDRVDATLRQPRSGELDRDGR